MKNTFSIAAAGLLTLALPALTASAQQQGRALAEQTLRREYGNGVKYNIYEDRVVNGVHVYTAAVDDRVGEANATYTEYGDAVDTGRAARVEDLPQPVAELIHGVFTSPPQLVNTISSHRYYANLDINGRMYVIDFDATGKILDMGLVSEQEQGVDTQQAPGAQPRQGKQKAKAKKDSLQTRLEEARQQLAGNAAAPRTVERNQPAQQRKEARREQNAAPNANEEQQIRQQFAKIFTSDKIEEIVPDPDTPGYYLIKSRNANGESFVNLNAAGEIPQYRVAISRGELPRPVQNALATMFRPDALRFFQRGEDHVYRVNEIANNQRVDMWIRGDGEVVAINEPLMPNQAIPAGSKTTPNRR